MAIFTININLLLPAGLGKRSPLSPGGPGGPGGPAGQYAGH